MLAQYLSQHLLIQRGYNRFQALLCPFFASGKPCICLFAPRAAHCGLCDMYWDAVYSLKGFIDQRASYTDVSEKGRLIASRALCVFWAVS